MFESKNFMKINAINQNRDYKRIYSRGKSIVTPCVVIYISRNRSKNVRIGITASKKIGGAVSRNRARRVIREAIRELVPTIKSGFDLVLVARARTVNVKSTYVKDVLIKQLRSAKLIE